MARASSARCTIRVEGRFDSPLLCYCALPTLRWGKILSERGIIQGQGVLVSDGTQRCSIPTAKPLKRPHPGSGHQRRAPLSHEDQHLGRFPSREGKGSSRDAFVGFNGFLTQRQGPLDFEVRYKAEIFWRAFRETYPPTYPQLGEAPPAPAPVGCCSAAAHLSFAEAGVVTTAEPLPPL